MHVNIHEVRWYRVYNVLIKGVFLLGGMNMNLFEELEWRGLVDNITSPEVKDAINNEKLTFYITLLC